MGCIRLDIIEKSFVPMKVVYRKSDFEQKSVQRFMSVDPLAHRGPGISPYAYAGNNPINNIDMRGDSITPVGANQHLQMSNINWDKGVGAGNGFTLYGGTGTNSSGDLVQMWVASNNKVATPSGSAEWVMNRGCPIYVRHNS